LIDYILVTEGGYLTLPQTGPTELSRPQIAKEIMRLDHRLAWQEDRWRFE